jgi:Arc/MetJ-type ribon-helix-helix transcriptional regulator
MTKVLEQAISEVEGLPEADQEEIGRQLLSHVQKLQRLRAELDKGIQSLDEGKGKPLDIEKFIAEQHARHVGE